MTVLVLERTGCEQQLIKQERSLDDSALRRRRASQRRSRLQLSMARVSSATLRSPEGPIAITDPQHGSVTWFERVC